MQRVLVTGGSGFIGYHLVRMLRQNDIAVRCLVQSGSNRSRLVPLDVEFVTGGLDSSDALQQALIGCDTVFHLAGLVRAKNYAEFERVNRFGTERLAQHAAAMPKPPVFLYVSSLAAAGCSTPKEPRRETMPPKPISHYGKSKLAGELALYPLADRMPSTIIRPGIVFGEADKMNLELVKTIKHLGYIPYLGYTDRVQSWIHAADLSALLFAAAVSGERIPAATPDGTGIYFAAADCGRPFAGIGKMIANSLGMPSAKAYPSPPLALLAIAAYYEIHRRWTGNPPPYDWQKAWESLHHWTCSPEKAQRQFNITPPPMQERFDQTIRWYKENKWLMD